MGCIVLSRLWSFIFSAVGTVVSHTRVVGLMPCPWASSVESVCLLLNSVQVLQFLFTLKAKGSVGLGGGQNWTVIGPRCQLGPAVSLPIMPFKAHMIYFGIGDGI